MATCAFHARMMAAFVPVAEMGPNLRAIYDRFASEGDQECIADESQVLYLFQDALARDLAGTPSGDGK